MNMQYYREVEFDTTVLNGLPVTIAGTVYGQEVGEWWITEVGGKPVKAKPPVWIYRKLTEKDREAIVENIYELSLD